MRGYVRYAETPVYIREKKSKSARRKNLVIQSFNLSSYKIEKVKDQEALRLQWGEVTCARIVPPPGVPVAQMSQERIIYIIGNAIYINGLRAAGGMLLYLCRTLENGCFPPLSGRQPGPPGAAQPAGGRFRAAICRPRRRAHGYPPELPARRPPGPKPGICRTVRRPPRGGRGFAGQMAADSPPRANVDRKRARQSPAGPYVRRLLGRLGGR